MNGHANPLIADVFHRAGLIEKWGRGTNRVIEMCRQAGIRSPEFHEIAGSAVVKFHVPVGVTVQVTDQVTAEVTAQVTAEVTSFCREPKSSKEIMAELGLKHWKTFQSNYFLPLIKMGIVERTIPDKPRSSKQKYRLTEKGREALRKPEGGRNA